MDNNYLNFPYFIYTLQIWNMRKILLILLLLSAPQILHAQKFGLKANAGTLGLGGEAVLKMNNSFNLRAGFHTFSLNYNLGSRNSGDFDFSGRMVLRNISGLIDLHPFGNNFRISGGLIYADNDFSAVLKPRKTYQIGGDLYTAAQLGNVFADIEYARFAPYASFGFGNVFSGDVIGYNIEFGIMFHQKPEVSMQAEGALAPTTEQAALLENNLEWTEYYPVLKFSIYFRLF
jgi:hypothetical protein